MVRATFAEPSFPNPLREKKMKRRIAFAVPREVLNRQSPLGAHGHFGFSREKAW
jgi:hypothetical protein